MINLGHYDIGPVAKLLVWKGGVAGNDRHRGVGKEFGGPVRSDGGAKLPGQSGAIGADPGLVAFPLSLGIPNETVGALVEHVIGHGDLPGNIPAVRTVIAENQHPVGMGRVDQVAGQVAEGGRLRLVGQGDGWIIRGVARRDGVACFGLDGWVDELF